MLGLETKQLSAHALEAITYVGNVWRKRVFSSFVQIMLCIESYKAAMGEAFTPQAWP
jgi:hypothetical protein